MKISNLLVLVFCMSLLPLSQGAERKGITFGEMGFALPDHQRDLIINDIFLYNNNEHVGMGDTHTPVGGRLGKDNVRKMFDGDPSTVVARKCNGKFPTFDAWLNKTATDMIIVSEKPETLKGVVLHFQGDNHKTVQKIDLGVFPAGSNVLKFDLITGKFKVLKKAPTLPTPPPYIRTPLSSLVAKSALLPLEPEKRSKYASFKVYGSRPGVTEGLREYVPDEEGVYRCKGTTGEIRFNKEFTLKDGQVFGITLDTGEGISPGLLRPTVTFGNAAFRVEGLQDLRDANGESYMTRSKEYVRDWRLTMAFHRKGDVIDWFLFGEGFDTCGTTKLKPGRLGENPQIRIQLHQPTRFTKYNVKNPKFGYGIAAIALGKPKKKLLSNPLPKAFCFGTWPKSNHMMVGTARRELKKKGINLPRLELKSLYGPLQPEELDALKKVVTHCESPKANTGNALCFSNAIDMAWVANILEISDDVVLLNALYKWSLSILEHRNDMPKGANLPNIMFMWGNRPTTPHEIAKSWNYHGPGGWGWAEGKPHLGTESNSAGGATCMMHFPLYVSRHPKLWKKTIPGTKKTYLEEAKYLAWESQAVLDDFMYKYFIEPDTGIARFKIWNRYSQSIETCMDLVEVYDNFKNEKDFYNKAKRDKCELVVKGFVDYFFNPTYNYTFYTSKGLDDDNTYAVGNWQYMPTIPEYQHPDKRKDIKPTGSEDLGHGAIEVFTLGKIFDRGFYTEKIGRAFAHEFGNTVRHRIYRGTNEKGQTLIAGHIRGGGKGSPGRIEEVFLWPALVNPDLYDLFVKDTKVHGKEAISTYCQKLWLRHKLYERGVVGPGEKNRKAPQVKIVVKRQKITDEDIKVELTAKVKAKPGSKIKSIEWDFNRDGVTDARGKTVTHTWNIADGTVFQAVVLATSTTGYSSSTDQAFVLPEMGPGTGSGTINGAYWEKTSSLEMLHKSSDFPNKPTGTFSTTKLQLNQHSVPSKRGGFAAMVDGYLHVPNTSQYEFKVQTNEAFELWLGSDEQGGALKKLTFNGTGRNGFTDPISLKAGAYRIRLLYLQPGRASHMSVQWLRTGRSPNWIPLMGNYLSSDGKIDSNSSDRKVKRKARR